MKRLYFCIFILMALVAVSFFSLRRVSAGGEELITKADDIKHEYTLTGKVSRDKIDGLVKDWRDYYKSVSFAENTEELNEIAMLFTSLQYAEDEKDALKECELIKARIRLLCENEYPYWYSVL